MAAIDVINASAIDAVKRSGVLEAGALMATVSTRNADGTITVTRGTDTYPNVRLLAGDPAPSVGDLVEILKTSGGWVCLGSLLTTKAPAGTVLDHRAGRVFITTVTQNVTVSANVTYAAMRAGSDIIVVACPQSGGPANCAVSIANQTTTGFTIYLSRTEANPPSTWLHWSATTIS